MMTSKPIKNPVIKNSIIMNKYIMKLVGKLLLM